MKNTQVSLQKYKLFLFLCCLFIILSGCRTGSVLQDEVTRSTILQEVPETPQEFRGVWVATVDNIDWPSEPGLPVARQKAELRAIMERAAMLNLNAVIFQVRPAADALYNSRYEPWSEYLTGKQGRAPEPYYDPLKFAIKAAHRRGLELHAWFNPFRAYHPAAETGFAPGHVKNEHPQWVVQYGDYYWLDPGQKKARQYSINVILDVVRRYNIDGVHLDDYFYPYPRTNEQKKTIPFPDEDSYRNYLESYDFIEKEDWRRQNVNRFVKHLSEKIKKVDSTVVFGISPFGIWRPGHPPLIEGFDAYAEIYADSRKWIRKGWVDYLTPQLYWPIGQEGQSFPVLLQWWSRQNKEGRYIWPGLYTNGVSYTKDGWLPNEIKDQIQLTRTTPGITGQVHFSMRSFMQNAGNISAALLKNAYSDPALVPAMPWISTKRPPKPDAALKNLENKILVSLGSQTSDEPRLWVVKAKYGNTWEIDIIPGWKKRVGIVKQTDAGAFVAAVVTAVNRLGNESKGNVLLPSVTGRNGLVESTNNTNY